jgi:hypothetical protein
MQPYVMFVNDLRRIGCCRRLFRISSLNAIVENILLEKKKTYLI